jgi:saccharopine dehydrogenase-like NADP-dependent oxidoreductase
MGQRKRIVIAGAGGIGRAVALLLREIGDLDVDVYLGDVRREAAKDAAGWVGEGSTVQGAIEPFYLPAEGFDKASEDLFRHGDLVLDCLPGSQAPRIAGAARKHGMHYVNITEYVGETEQVVALAQGADTGFLLQTGLAPGFVNVLGLRLLREFQQQHHVENASRLAMRVGALTKSAVAPHFYGFTWSPIGVSTEYVKSAILVRNHQKVTRASLSERATLIVDGLTLEEDLTSGGVADLCDALGDTVANIDYKTLRYPGHFGWVDGLLREIPEGKDRSSSLQDAMENAIPLVQDDVVIIHAWVEGKGSKGYRHQVEKSYRIEPCQVGAQRLRAIQSTTAAGMAESAYLLLTQDLKGVVLQSDIDPYQYMAGPFVSAIYGG